MDIGSFYIRGKLFHNHIGKEEDAGSDESIVVQAVYRYKAYARINSQNEENKHEPKKAPTDAHIPSFARRHVL